MQQQGLLPPYGNGTAQFSSQMAEAAPPISSRPPPLPGNFDEGDEEAERSVAPGKRWPRQETLVLLEIRSEMDAAFRDATLKAALWEEVSRRLLELGYNRSAKKCKEKFENVHKYYKRTKDSRAGGQDGRSYRFFTQLEALNATTLTAAPPVLRTSIGLNSSNVMPLSTPYLANSSSTELESSDDDKYYTEEISVAQQQQQGKGKGKQRRRKGRKMMMMMAFFERVMKQTMERQDAMQKRLLETIERREQEQTMREEAWRRREMERRNREEELLEQASAAAASRNAAIISFIYRNTDRLSVPAAPSTEMVPVQVQVQIPAPPSRWPKAEVEALIEVRSGLEASYEEGGAKAPPWEKVSAGMRKMGYSRSAKRCKEKWENINKYFKKVKESNKKRPRDAKTCTYFHQLDAIYRKKTTRSDVVTTLIEDNNDNKNSNDSSGNKVDKDDEQEEEEEEEEEVVEDEDAGKIQYHASTHSDFALVQ